MRWSKEHLAEYMLRFQDTPGSTNSSKEVADKGRESVLSNKIVKHCKEHAIPCLCFPQTKKVKRFLPPGWVD